MTQTTYKLAALPLLAALLSIGIPALAQDATTTPDTSTQNQTVIQQQSTTTTTAPAATQPDLTTANDQALALHDQAVILAHRATWAAQHHEKKLAMQLAGQAQDMFNQANQMTTVFAHRSGQ